jgi:predicted dehydrogenase
MRKIKVGLYGINGHQIHKQYKRGEPELTQLVALAGFGEYAEDFTMARVYETLDELLADEEVELVSLCSPMRGDQARDAVRALEAGKHVYAEKPVAMSEADLDAIIAAARASGKEFHEMGGVQFAQPYKRMREVVESGVLGEIVQIHGQKCYPWTERRPSDEHKDGGLALQVGVYLTRFVEHVAGVSIKSLTMNETQLGNPVEGHGCRMAVSMNMTLENGGLASGTANYLNPMGSKVWGYEILRIFGTKGIVESIPEDKAVRVMLQGEEPQVYEAATGSGDYFDLFVKSLLGQARMPLSIEDELSPTRWILRARDKAR